MSNHSIEKGIYASLRGQDVQRALVDSQQWLEQNPALDSANYLHGLSLLANHRAKEAIFFLGKAIVAQPQNINYLLNLGMCYFRLSDYQKAVQYFKQALLIKPDYLSARYNLASAYLRLEQAEPAKIFIDALVTEHPDNASYVALLADLARLNGEWQKAFRAYSRAIKLDDGFVQARINISPLLMQLGRTEKAVEHLTKAISLCEAQNSMENAKKVLAYQHLGDCYLTLEQPDEAMNAYADAYEINPENADLCSKIGNSWLDVNDLNEAEIWFVRSLDLEPEHLGGKIGLSSVFREGQEETAALEILLPLEEQGEDRVEYLMALGEAHWDEGNSDEALQCFIKVRDKEPQRLGIYPRIGRVLSSSGDVDGALAEYQKALSINKNLIPALTGLAVTQKGKLEPQYAERMEAMLKRPRLKDSQRGSLHNGLAFFFEGQKNFEVAAKHAALANHYQWQSKSKAAWHYSTEQHEKHVRHLKNTFDADYFNQIKALGYEGVSGEMPVFVLSMPRSGTTLTEQILARHPQVLGVGERNYASRGFSVFRHQKDIQSLTKSGMLSALTAESAAVYGQVHLAHLEHMVEKSGKENIIRVVDKMPDNYHQIAWLKTIFPKCKIIHIKRDPRDVALSCWFTQFGAIQWACKEEHLVDRIQKYQELMAHWKAVLGDEILEINYEDLVADQEGISRKMIEWIGLEWDESCLSFYDSDALVRTASITQVRQPIYKGSIKKWQKYAPYIPNLLDPLKPVD